MRNAVVDAHEAGFYVHEDLTVTDLSTGNSSADRAIREAEAEAYAADIHQRAADLIRADVRTADRISNAMAGLNGQVPESPRHRHHNRLSAQIRRNCFTIGAS